MMLWYIYFNSVTTYIIKMECLHDLDFWDIGIGQNVHEIKKKLN